MVAMVARLTDAGAVVRPSAQATLPAMYVFLLSRPKPLTSAEQRALPKGCVATDGSGGVVARAEVDLPLGGLLGYAVAMGRAVPDALFSAENLPAVAPVDAAPVAAAPSAPAAPTAPAAPPEVITETDPWKLFDAGKLADAERVFASGNGLDAPGRERCRTLLMGHDPVTVAFGCRVARVTNWKSIVVNLRPLLRHDHPQVRRDAVEAIGALAGPSMAGTVKPLVNDPDADVKAAATAALAKLGG